MEAISKLIQTIQGQNHDIPLFFPGIYDFKAALSPTPVHLFGQDLSDFLTATRLEIEQIGADFTVCGYDIYNTEAEAVGGRVKRAPGLFPEIECPLIQDLNEVHRLPAIDQPQGRIELYLKAASILQQEYQDHVIVLGTVSGPFTFAGKLYPKEQLLMDCMINPEGIKELLQYCTDIINMIVSRYCQLNIPVIVFDSLAAPPLVSPEIYRSIILPFHQVLFTTMANHGMPVRPLIIGGDTRLILDDYMQSGANLMLLDYSIPLDQLSKILDKYPCAFRVNLSPRIISEGTIEEIDFHAKEVLKAIGKFGNVILGTGVLPTYTPVPNICQIKKTLCQFYGVDAYL